MKTTSIIGVKLILLISIIPRKEIYPKIPLIEPS